MADKDKPASGFFAADKFGVDQPVYTDTYNRGLLDSAAIPAGATITAEELAPVLFSKIMERRRFYNLPGAANTTVIAKEDLPIELQCAKDETIAQALNIVVDAINAEFANEMYDDATVLIGKDKTALGISFDEGLDAEEILNALDRSRGSIEQRLPPKQLQRPESQIEGGKTRLPLSMRLTSQELAIYLFEHFLSKGKFIKCTDTHDALMLTLNDIRELGVFDPEAMTTAVKTIVASIDTYMGCTDKRYQNNFFGIANDYTSFKIAFPDSFESQEEIRDALKANKKGIIQTIGLAAETEQRRVEGRIVTSPSGLAF